MISIITPTKNRRKFISNILRNFYRQDYLLEKMELIIGDDSLKSNIDLIPDKKEIRYYHLNSMSLGRKRNYLCSIAKGDIIIFMDDDDYYPSMRVSNTVNNLTKYDCAGATIIYIYYINLDQIYRFGPYNIRHATAATLGFKKEFLINHTFDDKLNKAEEKSFLNNSKIMQLDPKKTILCFAHNDNTVPKDKFLNQGLLTKYKLSDFMNQDDIIYYRKLFNLN